MEYRRKLIEAALPLDTINANAKHEKRVKVGKPLSMHWWWARRPLAASRAIVLAQLLDDPSNDESLSIQEVRQRRLEMFDVIEAVSDWNNTDHEGVFRRARELLENQGTHPDGITLWDPFAGGGSIPLEAQRLGLRPLATDLNPVAVLINMSMIDIPVRFAGRPSINPSAELRTGFSGTDGLEADLEYYGSLILDRARARLSAYYPDSETQNGSAPTICWIWSRTVRCPNPACGIETPLIRGWTLCSKRGERRYLTYDVSNEGDLQFRVTNKESETKKANVSKSGFRCLRCGTQEKLQYIREVAIEAGGLRMRLVAVVADAPKGRYYLDPEPGQESVAVSTPEPSWQPSEPLSPNTRYVSPPLYGLPLMKDLFLPRQLLSLSTFSDLVRDLHAEVLEDAGQAMDGDSRTLEDGGKGARAYADAICLYLSFVVSRMADWNNAFCAWEPNAQVSQHMFTRQAIPMTWDFAEANPLGESTGSFAASLKNVLRSFRRLPQQNNVPVGKAMIHDAKEPPPQSRGVVVVSTDPPYYDNIGYADLADFFYVFLRRMLRPLFPATCATLMTPKDAELVVNTVRRPDEDAAERHFSQGMFAAFSQLKAAADPAFPVTIYYAFKQQEATVDGRVSTGWERMLEAVLEAGFVITGTWPVRTEMSSRMVGMNANALESSIVLVCRAADVREPVMGRREFIRALRRLMPEATRELRSGGVAPVDFAQASIGPGMAVFSRAEAVLEADGGKMSVRGALEIINSVLDETMAEIEGGFDQDTRWALAWYGQYGYATGPYGSAEVLSRAKNTSVQGIQQAGIAEVKPGSVRLLTATEYAESWDPTIDARLTIWECAHHLVKALDNEGEAGAARVLDSLPGDRTESARDLAYRVYAVADEKGDTDVARSFNGLVVAWPHLARQVLEMRTGSSPTQLTL